MKINYRNYHRDADYKRFSNLFENMFLMRYHIISKFIQKGKVLEIGSSVGTFLKIFRNNGWSVVGVEPSKSAKESQKYGIKVIQKHFEKASIPQNSYDLVVLNHTLEHMVDPTVVLRKVHSVLKSGGFIFIDVPNFGSLSSRLLGRNWPYLLPQEHRWQFTRKSLTQVLVGSGFEVIWQGSRSGIFEYAKPFTRIDLKHKIIDLFFLPYSFLATTLNMGDSMSFVAKKI